MRESNCTKLPTFHHFGASLFLLNCGICTRYRFSNVGKAPEWLAGFDFTLDVRKYGYVGTEAEEKAEPVAKL